MTSPTPGHLDPEAVEAYFRVGVRTAFPLVDEPPTRLVIDPARGELQLLTVARGGAPEVSAYERITLNTVRVDEDDGEMYELVIDASDMRYEAYVLVESIADQLRSGASFRHAFSESVHSLRELLSSRKRLTDEAVAGLVGELIVLGHLIDAEGEDAAITAWIGPLAEEHDFGLPKFDMEVKTTRSEGRIHMIGSDTQLEPVPGRPLYLISVQITRAGAAAEAFTLPALIADVRSKLLRTRRTFDSALEGLGWRDGDADLYLTRLQLRSRPRAYAVDSDFPAITSQALDAVVPNRAHVVGIAYRVDVTHLPLATAPAPMHDFCEAGE
ncbi:PD-(D/E)XK motif protein [Microbacterium trichothecenolyticum]|uniref:PD-(D/E)XK motif protein n=1 Tax=Microbacterium trichothecenolyticum TaxID=69370 RepID=UPI0035BE1FE7